MIAMIALRATVLPNVGPIDLDDEVSRDAEALCRASRSTRRWPAGRSASPSRSGRRCCPSVGLLDALDLRVAVAERLERVAHVVLVGRPLELGRRSACPTRSRCRSSGPCRRSASAPISRIDARHREEPLRRAHEVEAPPLARASPAPSARGCVISRERPIVPRIAWVASTAVNSETSVPMPSVKAKPLTPAVARMNRMNATMNVTTFASMIADEALRVAGRDRRGHGSARRGSPP